MIAMEGSIAKFFFYFFSGVCWFANKVGGGFDQVIFGLLELHSQVMKVQHVMTTRWCLVEVSGVVVVVVLWGLRAVSTLPGL